MADSNAVEFSVVIMLESQRLQKGVINRAQKPLGAKIIKKVI